MTIPTNKPQPAQPVPPAQPAGPALGYSSPRAEEGRRLEHPADVVQLEIPPAWKRLTCGALAGVALVGLLSLIPIGAVIVEAADDLRSGRRWGAEEMAGVAGAATVAAVWLLALWFTLRRGSAEVQPTRLLASRAGLSIERPPGAAKRFEDWSRATIDDLVVLGNVLSVRPVQRPRVALLMGQPHRRLQVIAAELRQALGPASVAGAAATLPVIPAAAVAAPTWCGT